MSSSPIMPAGPASCSLRRRGSSRPATEAHQTRLRNKSRSEVGGILSLRTPSFASRSETSAPIAIHGAQLGYLSEETAKRRVALPVIAPARQTNDVARRLPATEDIAAASDRGYRRSAIGCTIRSPPASYVILAAVCFCCHLERSEGPWYPPHRRHRPHLLPQAPLFPPLKGKCSHLSRLAKHFSTFYRTFSRKIGAFPPQETTPNPKATRIKTKLRPQLTATAHKCHRSPQIQGCSGQSPKIAHNSP